MLNEVSVRVCNGKSMLNEVSVRVCKGKSAK